MATTLPTEIIQGILLATDPESFHTARYVCKTWRAAAHSSFILRKKLAQCPVVLPDRSAADDENLARLWDEVAFANLFGVRNHIEKTSECNQLAPDGGPQTVTATSSDGSKMATLHAGTLRIYSKNAKTHTGWSLDSYRPLPALWSSVSRALSDGITSWMSMTPPSVKYHISLSTRGNLIAVALGRTIQIYDLQSANKNDMVEHFWTTVERANTDSSFGWQDVKGTIEGLDFAEHDTLLRVVIGKDKSASKSEPSRVRYLGSPPPQWGNKSVQLSLEEGLEYWRRNINKTYLDSHEAACLLEEANRPAGSTPDDEAPPVHDNTYQLRGMRLIPAKICESWTKTSGRFFLAALQCPTENGYCVGFLSDENKVSVLSRFPGRSERDSSQWKPYFDRIDAEIASAPALPSPPPRAYVSSDQSAILTNLNSASSRFHPINMPPSKTTNANSLPLSCPILASSQSGSILAVYEPGAGHAYAFATGGAIYLYRLRGAAKCGDGKMRCWDPLKAEEVFKTNEHGQQRRPLTHWSFLLDIVDTGVLGLEVRDVYSEENGWTGYEVVALTETGKLRWSLRE